jgi:putative radical SAM enzyme (TIGR03279 family)
MSIIIKKVIPNSPADKAGIKPGSRLISINGAPVNDVLDYMFHGDERMGLEFDSFLMDEKRGCKNKCVFCFIDQLPHGMRDSLYFKDDDSRLSFLQGNYITLTNLTEGDVARIIRMRTPVNVSVHTTNPDLRVALMGNPQAGQWSLDVLKRFGDAGVPMNCQLVLCPGINDGDELIRSLGDLSRLPSVESVACVPVGLTRFREGLTPLRLSSKPEAIAVIRTADSFENVFAADEFYLVAGLTPPDYEHYGTFPQYENGVGMWAYMKEHFAAWVGRDVLEDSAITRTIVTGTAAYPLFRELTAAYNHINVAAIRNNFFGASITVSGLLTGGDIIEQLREFPDLGDEILIGSNTLNTDGLLLDGVTPAEIGESLSVPPRRISVRIVEVE